MTYNGAESTTREAMGKVLGFKGIDKDAVNESLRNQLGFLKNVDKKIKEDFLSNNKKNFAAEVSALDFSKDSAADTINKCISNGTKGKIEKMLEPPIDPSVIMYLINAIYFKGEWSKKFDHKLTYDHAFKALGGREQTVRMMNYKGKGEYGKGDDYKAVRLSYGSGKTFMYCILPEEGVDINKFIENMSFEKWGSIRKI